jgi:hypothetical protein
MQLNYQMHTYLDNLFHLKWHSSKNSTITNKTKFKEAYTIQLEKHSFSHLISYTLTNFNYRNKSTICRAIYTILELEYKAFSCNCNSNTFEGSLAVFRSLSESRIYPNDQNTEMNAAAIPPVVA